MITEKTIPSTKFQNTAGQALDDALQDPLGITRRGRLTHVLLSASEYKRLKRRDQQAYAIENLPDDMVEALASATPPAWTEKYNDELR